MPLIIVFTAISAIVTLCVVIHYEFLYQLTQMMPRVKIRNRFRIVLGVIGALIAHSIEIWVFAIAYYWMHAAAGWGSLQGNYDGSLLASAYFSFTSYTTLGLGDIEPFGNIRYLVGVESLIGLLLITWTASFLYLEMTRSWDIE